MGFETVSGREFLVFRFLVFYRGFLFASIRGLFRFYEGLIKRSVGRDKGFLYGLERFWICLGYVRCFYFRGFGWLRRLRT